MYYFYREGRIDKKVEFNKATQYQAKRLFAHFYSLSADHELCSKFENVVPQYEYSMAKILVFQ